MAKTLAAWRLPVVLLVLGLLTTAPDATAQSKAVLGQVGLGSLASWQLGAGEPAAGDTSQYGLYLQKSTATANFSFAGASILPLPAGLTSENLSHLSFSIPGSPGQPFGTANGYCGAGAPRFNVFSGNGVCFLGCQAANKVQDATTGWWTIRFLPPFTQYAGCGVGIGGALAGIDIIMDEGTDIGPGNVIVDNIKIKGAPQSTVITGP